MFLLEDSYQVSFNYDYETVRNVFLEEDFLWSKSEKLEKVLHRLLSKVNLKFERLDKKNYLILTDEKGASSLEQR